MPPAFSVVSAASVFHAVGPIGKPGASCGERMIDPPSGHAAFNG